MVVSSYMAEEICKINGSYYRVERTYDLGQYVELYLAITPLEEDFVHG